MIWNLLVVLAVVVILILIARRLPDARKKRLEQQSVTSEEIGLYGLIAQADDAFEQKNYQKSEALYIKAAAEDPDNAKIYSRLGCIYLEQKNYYDAKDAFCQAMKLEPDLASRHVNLGLAFMGLKDYFKATDSFQKALTLDKKNRKYDRLLKRAQKLYEKEKKKK
ncbi:MAG TPA: tetratricopeptide repeat protein [Patescibacteria group bacterium]|nr:tetratricopeptide repeat protein [Patescibacteria group bacterium]